MNKEKIGLLLVEYTIIRLAMCYMYNKDKDWNYDQEAIYNIQYEEEKFWKDKCNEFNSCNDFVSLKTIILPYFIMMGLSKENRKELIKLWDDFKVTKITWGNILQKTPYVFLEQLIDKEETVKQKTWTIKELQLIKTFFMGNTILKDKIINNDLKESLLKTYGINTRVNTNEVEKYFVIIDKAIWMLHNRLSFMANRDMKLLNYWTDNSFLPEIYACGYTLKTFPQERFNRDLTTWSFELGPFL